MPAQLSQALAEGELTGMGSGIVLHTRDSLFWRLAGCCKPLATRQPQSPSLGHIEFYLQWVMIPSMELFGVVVFQANSPSPTFKLEYLLREEVGRSGQPSTSSPVRRFAFLKEGQGQAPSHTPATSTERPHLPREQPRSIRVSKLHKSLQTSIIREPRNKHSQAVQTEAY